MENTKERTTTGECSLPHSIQHIYERSANPRWNEEFHIRRRPVRHSQYLLNPELNQACRANTGCLRPTNVENLYLLAGIAPPESEEVYVQEWKEPNR